MIQCIFFSPVISGLFAVVWGGDGKWKGKMRDGMGKGVGRDIQE